MATSPDKLQACKWELEADMERFIQAAEVYCLPLHQIMEELIWTQNLTIMYEWTTYNMLILPPSFPCKDVPFISNSRDFSRCSISGQDLEDYEA